MKLNEYTLSDFDISQITSGAIAKNDVDPAPLFMNARFYKHMLQVQYEVASSVLSPAPVNARGLPVSGNNYIVSIAFGHVSERPTSAQEVMNIINTADAKVNCTCPSFYWQGMWEHNHSLKGDYPAFRGTAGTGMWDSRHALGRQPQACKHIWAVYNRISSDAQAIVDFLDTGV